VKITKV